MVPMPLKRVVDATWGEIMDSERFASGHPAHLGRATLLTKEGGEPVSLPGLGLDLDRNGITVISPEGKRAITLAWTEVTGLSTAGIHRSPDGESLSELVIATRTHSHHFLVPVSELETLAPFLASSRRHTVRGASLGLTGVGVSIAACIIALAHSSARLVRSLVANLLKGVGCLPRKVIGLPPRSIGLALSARSWLASSKGKSRLSRIALVGLAGLMLVVAGGGPIQQATLATAHLKLPRARLLTNPIRSPNAMIAAIEAAQAKKVVLAPATAPPLPAPPSLAAAPPLQPHEVFGFAPYWTLGESGGFALSELTTVAYFGVDVTGNGSLVESGSGWSGYESQDLASLISRAHAIGDRVVLTAECFSQTTLNQLTSDPSAPKTLATQLANAIEAKQMDGVNIDFEGTGSADRAGLTRLITEVSAMLRQVNPHWQITMDTYASSATDPGGFFDISALAPAVNAFFVMAYDMENPNVPSPTAPLSGPGPNDTEAVQEYLSVVAPSKVILGVPFYGYDWPTTSNEPGAQATSAPTPVSYAQIAGANTPVYWDPATSTPWTAYQVGSQWYQAYFDNPTSLALKAELANSYHLRGVGAWALGMDGNDPAMLGALAGNAPPIKDYQAGPATANSSTTSPSTTTTTTPPPSTTTTTTTPPPGKKTLISSSSGSTTYWYKGTWEQKPVTLSVESALSQPPPGGGTALVGYLYGFSTDNPSYECLSSLASLNVYTNLAYPGEYLVYAPVTPTHCHSLVWDFPVPNQLLGQ